METMRNVSRFRAIMEYQVLKQLLSFTIKEKKSKKTSLPENYQQKYYPLRK